MSQQTSSIGQLIDHLSHGWKADYSGLTSEFTQLWQEKLNAKVESQVSGKNSLRFISDLSEIRLRGMNDVPCLLTAGDGAEDLRDFWRKSAGLGRLPLVIALSEHAYRQAEYLITDARGLLLSSIQTKQLLTAASSREFLIKQLNRQIPKQRLIPFDFLRPAEGGMFFGRGSELSRLLLEDQTSFAIAGPGKVGKSSLIKHYQRQAIRKRDPRGSYRYYIDFYDCQDTSPDGVARFFAMKIDPSKKSSRMLASGLLDFMKYQAFCHGGALDLLLDEVDEVCHGKAFYLLGEAAKEGYCRLVLGGKGMLLQTMLSDKSPLRSRLELIKLEPLDPDSARQLFLEPLQCLELKISDEGGLIKRIFSMTGRLPHLLQLFGKKLATLAIEGNISEITAQHVETLKWDFSVAQMFTDPLLRLADAEARLLGLLLIKDSRHEFSVPVIQQLAAPENLPSDLRKITKLCNDLVISNVLSWCGGKYCVANESLYSYASNLGLLADEALDEARMAVRKQNELFPLAVY
ncbi:MAG: hypothetical protein HOP19_26780 [Acidobacteria bacterium]|nr:hypothetical protein [Acidobacteriota bacterium]